MAAANTSLVSESAYWIVVPGSIALEVADQGFDGRKVGRGLDDEHSVSVPWRGKIMCVAGTGPAARASAESKSAGGAAQMTVHGVSPLRKNHRDTEIARLPSALISSRGCVGSRQHRTRWRAQPEPVPPKSPLHEALAHMSQSASGNARAIVEDRDMRRRLLDAHLMSMRDWRAVLDGVFDEVAHGFAQGDEIAPHLDRDFGSVDLTVMSRSSDSRTASAMACWAIWRRSTMSASIASARWMTMAWLSN